jgi:hypothetical protein
MGHRLKRQETWTKETGRSIYSHGVLFLTLQLHFNMYHFVTGFSPGVLSGFHTGAHIPILIVSRAAKMGLRKSCSSSEDLSEYKMSWFYS